MLRELYFYFRKYKFVTIGIFIQTTFTLMLLGTFLFFISYLDSENTLIKEIYDNKAIFQVTDNYVEDKWDEFYNNPKSLNIAKDFYNQLNNSKDFDFLSINDLGVYISGEIDKSFYDNYENGREPNIYNYNGVDYGLVKSIQISKNSYDFFKLNVKDGRGFNDNDFSDNTSNQVPIILGNDYKSKYNVGDIIDLNYFGFLSKGKVIGFLEHNSNIITGQSLDTNLNEYIIMPWINFEDPKNADEYELQISTYMLRLSAYIICEDNPVSINNMRDQVRYLSQKTGFNEYLFLGENKYMSEYQGIITLLEENKSLVYSILVIISLLNIIILSLTMYLQSKRRTSYYAVRYLIGYSKNKLITQQWLESISVFISSYIVYRIIMSKIFVLIDFNINLILFIFIFILSIIVTITSYLKIINTSLSSSLNGDMEGD